MDCKACIISCSITRAASQMKTRVKCVYVYTDLKEHSYAAATRRNARQLRGCLSPRPPPAKAHSTAFSALEQPVDARSKSAACKALTGPTGAGTSLITQVASCRLHSGVYCGQVSSRNGDDGPGVYARRIVDEEGSGDQLRQHEQVRVPLKEGLPSLRALVAEGRSKSAAA